MSVHSYTLEVPRDQEIRYWMRAPVITVDLRDPLSDALALMQQHSVRRLPVVGESGELCGMITKGDIRGANLLSADGVDMQTIAHALRHITVQQVMSEHPFAVTPTTGLREAAMLMIEHKIGGLPVVEHDRTVVGIITESDLFEILVQQLDWQIGCA